MTSGITAVLALVALTVVAIAAVTHFGGLAGAGITAAVWLLIPHKGAQ
jgi:hypothetical protein